MKNIRNFGQSAPLDFGSVPPLYSKSLRHHCFYSFSKLDLAVMSLKKMGATSAKVTARKSQLQNSFHITLSFCNEKKKQYE